MNLLYDTKSIFGSKTFWGGLGAVVAGVAAVAGYVISPEDLKTIGELVTGIVSAVGGLLAIYGRITATKLIK